MSEAAGRQVGQNIWDGRQESSVHTFIHSPIHSFIQFTIYGTLAIPDTVLDAGEATENKTDKICVILELKTNGRRKRNINS